MLRLKKLKVINRRKDERKMQDFDEEIWVVLT